MAQTSEFGALLKQYRAKCCSPRPNAVGNMTQADLGSILGYAHVTVSNWENGQPIRIDQRDDVLIKLVSALVEYGGLPSLEAAAELVHTSGHAQLTQDEIAQISADWVREPAEQEPPSEEIETGALEDGDDPEEPIERPRLIQLARCDSQHGHARAGNAPLALAR